MDIVFHMAIIQTQVPRLEAENGTGESPSMLLTKRFFTTDIRGHRAVSFYDIRPNEVPYFSLKSQRNNCLLCFGTGSLRRANN